MAKGFEGFHRVVKHSLPVMAAPYLCPAGFWTKGFGRLCRQDDPPCTMEQAETWLAEDLAKARAQVLALTKVSLTDGQLDALTDWVFNLGSGRYRGSTLRAVINRGEFGRAPAEIRKWVYGGGQKLPGLVARREAEVVLWGQPNR